MYQNSQDENIYVTLEKMPEYQTKVVTTTNADTTYEKLTVSKNMEFHYTNNTDYIPSPTGYYYDMMWIEENETETIIYHVGSDSFEVTKEDLLQVAQHMQSINQVNFTKIPQ